MVIVKRKAHVRTFQPQPSRHESMASLWDVTLPIDVFWGIYARQSTQAQLVKNPESTEMQTEDLQQWLLDRRVTKHHILLFDADLGKSGTLRIDQRTGLQELVLQIKAGKVKAVLVYRVSRLFRDETGVQYNVFANICKEHNCLLVTADGMIFNFNNPMHMKMFRFLAEQAAEYIPQQLEVLREARLRKARRGFNGFGGTIPIGFIVDYREDSKTFHKYIAYEPHAKVVRFIFERFYVLEGDFAALCRELEAMPVLFKEFEPWVDKRNIPKKRRKRVVGGYHISENGLRLMLTNPVYVGWWIVQQEIVSRNNHTAIFDKEHEYLFWYAFERMASHTVDGKVNDKRQRQDRSFFQRHTVPGALLQKKKLQSPQGEMTVYPNKGKWAYHIIDPESHVFRRCAYTIEASAIDPEVSTAFLSHLKTTHDFDEYRKWLATEESQRKSLQEQVNQQLAEADSQLEALLDARLEIYQHINTRLKTMLEEDPALDTAAAKEQLEKEAAPDLARLDRRKEKLNALVTTLKEQLEPNKKKEPPTSSRKLASFQEEVEALIAHWDKKPMHVRSEFLMLFTYRVVVTVHSPHWIGVDIYWRHPLWEEDHLFIYRQRGAAPHWTPEEREIVRQTITTESKEVIMQQLPTKTWQAILVEARHLGLGRPGRLFEPQIYPKCLTWPDICFMREADIRDLNTKSLTPSERQMGIQCLC